MLINVLFILMGIAGPTVVAGLNGTTASFLSGNDHKAAVVRVVRGR